MSPVTDSVVVPAGYRIDYDDDAHRYWIPFPEEVASVTTALGVLDKPALPWWGMTQGVAGVSRLHELGVLPPLVNPDAIVKALTANKLTVNHVKGKAAARGVGAHHALEQLAATGRLDLSKIEPEDQGYASAVLDWWLEANPTECVTEQMVGSRKHGFAGRYDLDCRLDVARCLVDLKTSKAVYDSHLLQLELYGIGAAESGYGKFDNKYVLRAGADGSYEFVRSYATAGQALDVLRCYKAMQRLKRSKPKSHGRRKRHERPTPPYPAPRPRRCPRGSSGDVTSAPYR